MKADINSVVVLLTPEFFGELGVISSMQSPYFGRPYSIDTSTYGGKCFARKDFEVIDKNCVVVRKDFNGLNIEVIKKIIERNTKKPVKIISCDFKETDDDMGTSGEHLECTFKFIGSPAEKECLIRTDVYNLELSKQTEITMLN